MNIPVEGAPGAHTLGKRDGPLEEGCLTQGGQELLLPGRNISGLAPPPCILWGPGEPHPPLFPAPSPGVLLGNLSQLLSYLVLGVKSFKNEVAAWLV